MQRRQFLASSIAATLVSPAALSTAVRAAAAGDRPRILLRSSWQTVNIGDIAHTPGVLALLETYLPEADVYLWPSKLDNGVDALLLARFPKLKFVQTGDALKDAFESCDFLLHSSGASLVAEKDIVRWSEATGKPYGVYGITLPPKSSTSTVATPKDKLAKTIQVLSGAEFTFFRDSKSLAFAKQLGCTCPVMEFGPDGAFACDLRDEAKAEAFLCKYQLETGKFLCCIPRLRYTPYWTIPSKNRKLDPVKHARNEEMKEHDHAPLRQAIIDVVEQTDLKVLICPEDQTQMQVGKEMLYDKLPAAIRQRVVWREDYWLTGEAISTYVRSAGLFGNEMHSPIMCIGHGIPAIVCRWAEQTTKGYMWEDIGLGDWLFDLDNESEVAKVAPTVLALAKNPHAAKAKAAGARKFVEKRQRETMAHLAKAL
ncbi:polysaccharide pyruvyl transferase family protein [Candidatus Laterigemmans baculatus]|uniref:polysaccharide pyruvyl transferase family protein n=1 Tax=Candidatus Laterigemmans baculatus TaxID=2770505 RepID=UPI0013DB8C72|nr:polysaccharide pyruvyl transferase family protein [Candidatus Laterigemmans baculatus]